MEHNAKRADRLQVAEHRRGEQARRTSAATSTGVSWPAVGRQAARRARCLNRGRAEVCSSPSRPLLRFVRSGSEAGVDAGGCSATRAVARCACRSRRIGPPASTSTTPANAPKQGRRPIRPERPTVDDAAEPGIGEQQVATWSQARPCICADAGTMATSGLIGVLSHRLREAKNVRTQATTRHASTDRPRESLHADDHRQDNGRRQQNKRRDRSGRRFTTSPIT